MRTLTSNDIYLAALHAEAKRLVKLEIGTIDVQFADRAMGANLLVALQEHPKPGKAYVIKLVTETGITHTFDVEPLQDFVFRVTLKKG
jgi:hypothetical protein